MRPHAPTRPNEKIFVPPPPPSVFPPRPLPLFGKVVRRKKCAPSTLPSPFPLLPPMLIGWCALPVLPLLPTRLVGWWRLDLFNIPLVEYATSPNGQPLGGCPRSLSVAAALPERIRAGAWAKGGRFSPCFRPFWVCSCGGDFGR